MSISFKVDVENDLVDVVDLSCCPSIVEKVQYFARSSDWLKLRVMEVTQAGFVGVCHFRVSRSHIQKTINGFHDISYRIFIAVVIDGTVNRKKTR